MTSAAPSWDAQAAAFDQEPDHGLIDPEVRAAWEALLRPRLPERSTVLDLGCGTGSLTVLLAEQGHSVTGVDLSPRMLDRARDKARRRRVDPTFLLGDASDPPVRPAFDVVFARHVVWALPDPSKALDRWVDVLRPHGTMLAIEGLWGTGSGLSAQALLELLAPKVCDVTVRPLDDPALWGRAVTDERYLITASR